MWGNKKHGSPVAGGTTLISSDTVIVGDVHFSGTLDIEGLVQGNVIAKPETKACVRVVNQGRVEGDISAPSVVINGTVEGDVHSTGHLELAARAKVQGNVFYTVLEMVAGSEVNGSLAHVAATIESERISIPDPSVEVTEVGESGSESSLNTRAAKS